MSEIGKEYICPHCKQAIYDEEALLCHFCGESLGRTSGSMLGKIKGRETKWFLILIVVITIASFLIFMH